MHVFLQQRQPTSAAALATALAAAVAAADAATAAAAASAMAAALRSSQQHPRSQTVPTAKSVAASTERPCFSLHTCPAKGVGILPASPVAAELVVL
eukprot:1667270-Alexandrium_andersonii.AAC.1